MDGWMDGWMHACMHGWMHGWMDGWMDGSIDRSIDRSKRVSEFEDKVLWLHRIPECPQFSLKMVRSNVYW